MIRERRLARALRGASFAASVIVIVTVALVARHRSSSSARCPDGMVSLGARCCGEGQRLDQGRCTGKPSRCAKSMLVAPDGCTVRHQVVAIPGGTLPRAPADWEGQGVGTVGGTVESFLLDASEVTEARYAECLRESACAPLPLSGEPGRPVFGVTLDEARRFCSWAGGRLPTSHELGLAAAGASDRRYPWGDTGAVCRRVAWGLVRGPCAWGGTGPELSGSRPDADSPQGVHDLVGNVEEWSIEPDGKGALYGGSYADEFASAVRSWSRRRVGDAPRLQTAGFRCAYSF